MGDNMSRQMIEFFTVWGFPVFSWAVALFFWILTYVVAPIQSRLHCKFKIKQNKSFISNKSETISCRRLETKSRSVRNDDFGFRRKAQVRTNQQIPCFNAY